MSAARRIVLRGAACAALLLGPLAGAWAQNETPGTGGKKNHTAYYYAPFKWDFKLFDIEKIVKASVGTGDESGQQYEWVEMIEAKKPTDANPAKICTLTKFRDLINKNQDDMGVLVISSHGSDNATSVEAFTTEKARDKQYDAYTSKDGGFTTDEIIKTSNDDAYSISVTDKFIQKYRKLGQALVYLSTCEGSSIIGSFTDDKGTKQPAAQRARVALGADKSPKVAIFYSFTKWFFVDLDGQPRKDKADADRVKQRAVKPAMDSVNNLGLCTYQLSGDGATTLAPVVRDDLEPCMSPLKKGDTVTFTFDTNCDTTVVPTVKAVGVTLDTPVWKKKNVLEVPVTAPAEGAKTFKITLQGSSVKAAQNAANLDGNSNPDKSNGQGPATAAKKSDDFVIEYKDGARVH